MFQTILVAVDGTRQSNRALASAIGLARNRDASVHILHVFDEHVMDLMLDPTGLGVAVPGEAGQRLLGGGLVAPVVHGHPVTGRGEGLRDGGTDAPRCAGDQDGSVLHHVRSLAEDVARLAASAGTFLNLKPGCTFSPKQP